MREIFVNTNETSYTCGSDFHPHVKTNISYLHEGTFYYVSFLCVVDIISNGLTSARQGVGSCVCNFVGANYVLHPLSSLIIAHVQTVFHVFFLVWVYILVVWSLAPETLHTIYTCAYVYGLV